MIIYNISIKCSKLIGILKINKKWLLPLNKNITSYNYLMVPYTIYGNIAWGFNYNRIIKLEKKQLE